MIFNDYYTKITTKLLNKRYSKSIAENNTSKIFDCYINDTPINECIKLLLKNTINESTEKQTPYEKYRMRVITLLETMGYKKEEITNTINKKISDTYDIEEDEYACAELCKDELQRAQKYKPIKLTTQKIDQVKNNIIINLHSVHNAALLNLDVSPTAAKIKLKVRLFTNLNYINTDVKSYIKLVHKYLNAFVCQNSNTALETKILSYSIKYNNLYCTTEIVIPLVNQDGLPENNFNIYDISCSIKSHLNVLETFSEQYKNIIK